MNSYLSEPNFLENNLKYSGQQKEQIEQLVSFLVTNKPLTFEECIIWARLQFEEKYSNSIQQLLYSLPKDSVTSTGQPFWSGPKRAPDALRFDANEVRLLTRKKLSCLLSVSFFGVSLRICNTSLPPRTCMRSTTACAARLILRRSRRSQAASSCPSSPPRAASRFRSTRTNL